VDSRSTGRGGEEGGLSGNLAKLIVTDDLELSKDVRLDRYYAWLLKFKKDNAKNYVAKAKEIHDEAQRLEIKDKASLLLVKVFISPDNAIEDIKKHRPILLRFTIENKKAQKYMLGGIEVLIAGDEMKLAELMPKTLPILKALYDEDIIEEEALLDWGKKATKKYVKKEHSQAMIDAAQKLLEWLEQAEEETSEEEHDDTKIEFTNKEKAGVHKEEVKQQPAKASDEDEEDNDSKSDEELDIDNI